MDTLLSPASSGKAPLYRRVIAYFARCPRTYLYAAFGIPAFLTFLMYALAGVHPFGNTSVLVLDLNAQYIYFFDALRDFVYGDGSLLYSFRRAMGGEFMGIYTYYLASPLSYIVCLFPRANMPEAIWCILCIKSGLCGLTFAYCLRTTAKTPPAVAVALSAMYAFSGYALALQSNTMWIDGVYLLPLIATGIHRLIREKKVILYTLSLAATLLCNYYIGYMTCIFVLFYFFAAYFSYTRDARNPDGERAHFLRSLCRIGIFSVIAVAMAGILLAPAYYGLTFGKDTFTNPTFDFISLYPLLDVFGKLLFASYDTIAPAGLPFLYSGILTLFLVPLYFLSKKISPREKVANGILLLLWLFIATTKATDLVMHGFQAPNWMNCRYAFFFTFFLLFLAGRFLSEENEIPEPRKVVGIGTVLLAFTVAYFCLSDDKSKTTLAFILSALLLVFYGLSLCFMHFRPEKRQVLSAVTAAILGVEILASGLLGLYFLDCDVVISWRSNYAGYDDRFTDISEYVAENDPSPLYRAERTVARKMNDNYQIRLNGLSGSTSTLNRSQIDFLYAMGINSRSHFSQYDYANPVTDMLLGVKYIFAAPDQPLYGHYTLRYVKCAGKCITLGEVFIVEERDDGMWLIGNGGEYRMQVGSDVLVYENELALPLGYAVSQSVNSLTLVQPEIDESGNYIIAPGVTYYSVVSGDGRSAPERLNTIASALYGENITLWTKVRHTAKTENAVSLSTYRSYEKVNEESGKKKTEHFQSSYYKPDKSGETATVTFTFRGVSGKHIYMYIPCASYDETSFTLNGKEMGNYFGTFNYGIRDLGEFPAGSENTVTFTIPKDGLHVAKDAAYFYTLDDDALIRLYDRLSDAAATVTRNDSDHIEMTVTATAETPVFTMTIPYDEGWNVTVDGIPAETFRTLDALLGISLTPGTHTLTFDYFPAIYRIGIRATVIGTVAFLSLGVAPVVHKKKKKKKKKDGDAVLTE